MARINRGQGGLNLTAYVFVPPDGTTSLKSTTGWGIDRTGNVTFEEDPGALALPSEISGGRGRAQRMRIGVHRFGN